MLENSVLPSLQSPIRYSYLCQAYDSLMEALVREQSLLLPSNHNDEKDTSTGASESREPHPPTTTTTESVIVRQADYLRALQLTCKLLLGILATPSVSESQASTALSNGDAPTSKDKKAVLEQTIQRCGILLEGLAAHQTNNCFDPTSTTRSTSEPTMASSLPESQYSILRHNYLVDDANPQVIAHQEMPGLYTYRTTGDDHDNETHSTSSSSDEEDDNLLSLDRATLAQEEQDLIHMASTPIPGE